MKMPFAVAACVCALAAAADAGTIRFVNGSPGAPALDLFADDQLLQSGVAYASAPDWMDSELLANGPYSFEAAPTGGGDPLAQADFDFADRYTAVAVGPAESMELLFLQDIDHQHGNMTLRFVNLSPDAPPIDLVKAGGPHVLFEDVGYKETGGFDNFAIGPWDFEFRDSATGEVLLELSGVQLGGGRVHTIWLMGYAGGQGPDLQAVVTTDAIPAPGPIGVAALVGIGAARRRR